MIAKSVAILAILAGCAWFSCNARGVGENHAQPPSVARTIPEAGAKLSREIRLTVEPGHPWTPPFGLERVGRPLEAVVEVPDGVEPTEEYMVVGYRGGQEISRQPVKFIDEHASFLGDRSKARYRFGRVVLHQRPSTVVLLVKKTDWAAPVEAARADAKPPAFEAEAVARPDKIINPVDLGTILPPTDWLLLAGGQNAEVEVAALCRDGDVPGAMVNAWFESALDQRLKVALALSKDCKAQVKLALQSNSPTRKRDVLHLTIVNGAGKEIWRQDVPVMRVHEVPRFPRFGAVETRLRFDLPIPVPGGRTINYDDGWDPKFQDVVIFLPNGARFVFWRGSSYIPFWAGPHNTGFSYQWAERGSPPPWGEPLMDHELRYGRVEIVESTEARIHVRWRYQACNEGYTVTGDLAVEDYYFYPDGLGTRVLTLTCIPPAAYELNEFIILTPQAGYPFALLPAHILDMLWSRGGKAEFRFPHFPGEQEEEKAKVKSRQRTNEMPLYRVRIDTSERLAVIQYSPWGWGPTAPGDFLPELFGPQCERGAVVTPAYWGNHWPLSREGGAGNSSKDRIRVAPAHNSILSTGCTAVDVNPNPMPLRRERLWMRDGLGQLKLMRRDTFAWLIGMTDAGDDELRLFAQSFAQPPAIEVKGAELDANAYYTPERRALCLKVKTGSQVIELEIAPAGRCVDPVFEFRNAPKTLSVVHLNDRLMDTAAYRWDGATLWLAANLDRPATLNLVFGNDPPEK